MEQHKYPEKNKHGMKLVKSPKKIKKYHPAVVIGFVRKRLPKNINPNEALGKWEIVVEAIYQD